MKLRNRLLLAVSVLSIPTQAAASARLEHFAPVLFELEPNMRYASTDLTRWEVFTRTGVRLSPSMSIEFLGVDERMKLEGVDAAAPKLSIYLGNDPAKWKPECAGFNAVAYRGLYPGIDLVYHRMEGKLKGDFIVHRGADPARIRFRFTGEAGPNYPKVRLHRDRLEIRSGKETLDERIPSVYQIEGSSRVEAHYRRYPDGSIGFEVAGHDPERQLVIDPDLTFSSFVAGSLLDQVTATTFSPVQNMLLVAGWTESGDLLGATASTFKGSIDAYYGRFSVSAAGAVSLSSMTLIGGSGADKATSIAVNPAGVAVLGGSTTSTNFPALSAYQATLKGRSNGFLVQFSPFGTTLLKSTYFGGSGSDQITGVGIDSSGVAYFAGTTSSTNLPLRNAIQATYNGGATDGFAGTLLSNATLGYSTYLGGAGTDNIAGLAQLNGEVYLTGGTDSNGSTTIQTGLFPLKNPNQAGSGGGQDAFVTKLTSAGALFYSSLLGGNGGIAGYPETGNAITVNPYGEAFVVGMTSSSNFPLVSPAQRLFGSGPTDAFLAKYSATGSLVFSTYWGGASWDQANAVTILPSGFIAVAGMTSSQDTTTVSSTYAFPTQVTPGYPVISAAPTWNPVSARFEMANGTPAGDSLCSNTSGIAGGTTFGGYYDAFVAVFWPTGACYWSAYYGGIGSDAANSITATPAGELFLAGQTGSHNLQMVKSLQTSISSSGYHGFLAKLTPRQSGLFRSSLGQFYLINNYDFVNSLSPNFITMSWANVSGSDAIPIVGDWDNTGRPRLGLFRSGTWYLDINGDNLFTFGVDQVVSFGAPGDLPVVGDWDNTGRSRIGVYRAGLWFLDINGDNSFTFGVDCVVAHGVAGDFPIVGDWTNTGQSRIGVVSSNVWKLATNVACPSQTINSTSAYNFGAATDYPVFADWDNSGIKRIGAYRTSGYPIGWWYLDINGNGAWDDLPADRNVIVGGTGDIPVVAIRAN